MIHPPIVVEMLTGKRKHSVDGLILLRPSIIVLLSEAVIDRNDRPWDSSRKSACLLNYPTRGAMIEGGWSCSPGNRLWRVDIVKPADDLVETLRTVLIFKRAIRPVALNCRVSVLAFIGCRVNRVSNIVQSLGVLNTD